MPSRRGPGRGRARSRRRPHAIRDARRRARHRVPGLPGEQRLEHGRLASSGRQEEQGLEAVDARGLHAAAPRLRPADYGMPFDVVDGSHADRARRLRLRRRERSRARTRSAPTSTIEGGSDRHAIMIDRDTCTLYELFAADWNGGEPTAGSGAIFHLDGPNANDLRPATWTSRRRRRPADLPGPRPLGRGDGRRDRARDPVHRGLHEPALRLAGAPSGGRAATAAARRWARGSACKAGFDASRFSADATRHPRRDEALRPDRGRQRQRLVLPGRGELPLDERPDGRAEVDPRGRVRRGGRRRLPRVAELRRVRLRPAAARRPSARAPGSSRRSAGPRA